MPERNSDQLIVLIQYICRQPLRRLLYSLANATVAPGTHFDFDSFLRSERTLLDNLVKLDKISRSQYHRIFHLGGKSNINDLDVYSLVMLLVHLFDTVLSEEQHRAISCIERRYYSLLMLSVSASRSTLVTNDRFESIWKDLEDATLILANTVNETDSSFYFKISELIKQVKCNDLPDASSYVETWYTELSAMQTDTEKSLCHQCKLDCASQIIEPTDHQLNRKIQVEKKEIIHYKVSLTCWPRLHHLQELVERLVGYCHELEAQLELPGTDKQHIHNIDNVDVFVRGNAVDIKCLATEADKQFPQDTEISFISETLTHDSSNGFDGIFIDFNGVRLVDALSEATLFVRNDATTADEGQTMMSDISNLIEVALFKPLFEKVDLLRNLILAASCDITDGCLQVVDGKTTTTEIVYDRLKAFETLNAEADRQSYHIHGMDFELNQVIIRKIREYESHIDRLLGEMIALTNRSTLSDKVRPVVEGYKTKEISKQIAEDLFKLHPTIKGCGYRYSTLYINAEHISDASENDRRNERIEAFLSSRKIKDYKIDTIESHIKEYKYVGAEMQSEIKTKATLGCFSVYIKENRRSLCCLLSKHFVLGSNRIFVNENTHFGTILPATNEEGGHDIAAAEIVKLHCQDLDMNFRNYEDQVRPALLYENTDSKMLQDQPVYLRGAKTKLGVGTIRIPKLQCSDDTDAAYIQIIDGNFTLNMPFGRLAEEGDSGAILCMDEIGTKNVCVISMLMGELLRKSEEETRIAKIYSTLRLSCGLKYLEDKTQGKFILGGTLSGKEIVDEILWDLFESLQLGRNVGDHGDKIISLRK